MQKPLHEFKSYGIAWTSMTSLEGEHNSSIIDSSLIIPTKCFFIFSIKVRKFELLISQLEHAAIGHHVLSVPISCDCAAVRVPAEAQECIVPFCSWQKITKQFIQPCAPPLSSSHLVISGGISLGNYDFSVFQGQSSIVRFFSVFQLEELLR